MIEFHRLMLADRPRNEAFTAALRQAIRPGESVVADIGSGTGYLGFVASRLGAKECHLYEFSEALGLSKDIAKASGVTACTFHRSHSTQVKKPAPADIVVSETLGNYALEENILETLRDARRFLKLGGVMIPQTLRQFVAPVVTDKIHKELDVWDLGHGLDFGPARELCFNNVYVRTLQESDLLPGGAKQWDEIDFRTDNESIREARAEWMPAKAVTVYGFALWWECDLFDGIELSTAPGNPKTHWEQIYLPVPEPVNVAKDTTVGLDLRSDTRYEVKVRLQWSVEYKKQKQEMDMWKGIADN